MPSADRLREFFGTWGLPSDGPAMAALACACVLAVIAFADKTGRWSRSRRSLSRGEFLTLTAFAAAALSLGYVAHYLRGGPRIIDATSYYLQARAMSEGHLAWPVPEPSAAFRGRFLLFTTAGDDTASAGRLAGIFPPGYPALLALGFWVGAPLVVGPAIAAGLVVATYALAREVAPSVTPDEDEREAIARMAALLSIACAALRYHTADTMAHGATALGITIALAASLHACSCAGDMRAKRGRLRPFAHVALAGWALGYVAATRPVSALPIGAAVVYLACAKGAIVSPRASAASWVRRILSRDRLATFTVIALSAAPGIALLLAAQRAATGHAFVSTQRAYYAVSDGPPGCFRYGFGAAVGCIFEHGEFVRARLPHGYGAWAALGTTARRLKLHLADIANFEPLALLVLVPITRVRRFGARPSGYDHRIPRANASPVSRVNAVIVCTVITFGHIAAYVPFYFDGNYPGGGARFFADVLPIEHVLLATAIALLLPAISYARRGAILLAIACAGFAIHASFAHASLAARDGGALMFDPDVLARAGVTRGLLFVDSDHAFGLAHDPNATMSPSPATDSLVVARLRGDDHDRLLYERLGHPLSWRYRMSPPPPSSVGDIAHPGDALVSSVEPWFPALAGPANTWHFEAENDWPPLSQRGGWAAPEWVTTTCASSGRVLSLARMPNSPSPEVEARIAVDLPPLGPAAQLAITPRLLYGDPARDERDRAGALHLITRGGEELASWSFGARAHTNEILGPPCVDLASVQLATAKLPIDLRSLTLVFTLASAGDVADAELPRLTRNDATPNDSKRRDAPTPGDVSSPLRPALDRIILTVIP